MRAPRPATGAHWMAYGDRLREATHSARPYEQSARALGAGRSGGQLRGRPASRLGAHFSDDARVLLHSYCDCMGFRQLRLAAVIDAWCGAGVSLNESYYI